MRNPPASKHTLSGGLIFVHRARATPESGLTRSNSRRRDEKEISESYHGIQERAQRRACRRENSQRAALATSAANRSSPQMRRHAFCKANPLFAWHDKQAGRAPEASFEAHQAGAI